jgi:hypothetical protein
MITSIGLCALNSVVIPRLGLPFFKIFFQISKINKLKGIRIRLCLLSRISKNRVRNRVVPKSRGKMGEIGGHPAFPKTVLQYRKM